MKKIITMIAIIVFGVTESVFGATMCVKNDTISIILDPGIGNENNSTYGYSTAQSTWWTAFPYGTIRGISACLSSSHGKSRGGYVSGLTDTNPDTNETAAVVGGETNGLHCWCKKTHPAASLWVFNGSRSSASDCASGCASHCGFGARAYSDLRAGLFGSVRN